MNCLNRNQLKYLAVFAMLLDHVAVAFLPNSGPLYFILRMIGRITGPTMAYFLAEGYVHTRNLKRYALRLFLFAIISWFPFAFFLTGRFPIILNADNTISIMPQFSVFYTLFLGLCALWAWDNLSDWIKLPAVLILSLLALFGDWSFYNIFNPLIFHIFKDTNKKKWTIFSLLALFHILSNNQALTDWYRIGILLVPFLIQYCYNGQPGRTSSFSKWFFYLFYPAHLLILGLLRFHN